MFCAPGQRPPAAQRALRWRGKCATTLRVRHLLPHAGGARARQKGRFPGRIGLWAPDPFPPDFSACTAWRVSLLALAAGPLVRIGAFGAGASMTLRPAYRNGLHFMVRPCPPGLFHICAVLIYPAGFLELVAQRAQLGHVSEHKVCAPWAAPCAPQNPVLV